MSSHRLIWLGILGAAVAAVAVPTTANAAANFTGNGVYSTWAGASPMFFGTQEFTCISSGNNCANGTPNAEGAQVNSIHLSPPLQLSNALTLANPATIMRRDINGSLWTNYWPADLKTGANPYTGDIWASDRFETNNITPVTQISLHLNSPVSYLGFVAVPEGLEDGNGSTFTVTVTTDADNAFSSKSFTETMSAIGTNVSCSIPAGSDLQPAPGTGTPCGFFGLRSSGNPATSFQTITVTIATNDPSEFCNGPGIAGRIRSAATVCDVAGIGIGDFVEPIPEPKSLALLGVGLIGLGLVRRRLYA